MFKSESPRLLLVLLLLFFDFAVCAGWMLRVVFKSLCRFLLDFIPRDDGGGGAG